MARLRSEASLTVHLGLGIPCWNISTETEVWPYVKIYGPYRLTMGTHCLVWP